MAKLLLALALAASDDEIAKNIGSSMIAIVIIEALT